MAKKFRQKWSQNGANSGKWGLNIRFYDRDPERHIFARNRVFWHILRQNVSSGQLAVASCKNPKPKKTSRVNIFVRRECNPGPFCQSRDFGIEFA